MFNTDATQARDYFARKLAFVTGPHEVDGMLERGERLTIVDVRLPTDYRRAHVPGAVNLPKGKWHTVKGLVKDRPTVVYCYDQTCKLAAEAAVELASHGFAVVEMEGGFAAWEAKGLPVETESRIGVVEGRA